MPFVESLLEHLDASDDGGLGLSESDDFDLFASLYLAAFDSSGDYGATALDAEDIFDRHDEGQVDGPIRDRDVIVNGFHEFVDLLDPFVAGVVGVLKRFKSADLHNGEVVTGEVVRREQFTDFELDEFEQFLVVHHVAFVESDDECRDVHLSSEQDVLARLRHGAVGGGHDQNSAVHLGGTSDHVLDVVRVAGAVNVSVVPVDGLVFGMGGSDGDTSLPLFGSVVDVIEVFGRNVQFRVVSQNLGDRRGEGCLAVVDVPDSADVNVRLGPVKDLLRHFPLRLPFLKGSCLCTIFRRFTGFAGIVSIVVPAFVEPTPRLELGTSFLPRMCSTTELCGLGAPSGSNWSLAPCLVQGVGFEPTKHKAADLQSAGFDRSPIPAQPFILTQLGHFELIIVTTFVTVANGRDIELQVGPHIFGAPGGIRTHQPANYKSAALPLRHWGFGNRGRKRPLIFDVNSVGRCVQSRRGQGDLDQRQAVCVK